jgi:LPXTG-motif cell wall-anchored protein
VTPPADGTLPRTGADSALPAAMAALLLGAAFGVRRLVCTEKVEI